MDTTTKPRNRVTAGTKSGGQYATELKAEPVPARAAATPKWFNDVGPSDVIRGQSIGYSVTESRMSRQFIAVEDREAFAEHQATKETYRCIVQGKDPGLYRSTTPEHWMTQFDAYDIFEEEAPADYSADQKLGYDSVSLKALNLDLDHQSLSYNAFSVEKNEKLARDADGNYRKGHTPEHQAQLDAIWGARADRLTDVRTRLQELAARQ